MMCVLRWRRCGTREVLTEAMRGKTTCANFELGVRANCRPGKVNFPLWNTPKWCQFVLDFFGFRQLA